MILLPQLRCQNSSQTKTVVKKSPPTSLNKCSKILFTQNIIQHNNSFQIHVDLYKKRYIYVFKLLYLGTKSSKLCIYHLKNLKPTVFFFCKNMASFFTLVSPFLSLQCHIFTSIKTKFYKITLSVLN